MDEFKVIFLDDDKKTILAEVQVEYGEKAVYPNETPTKDTIQGVKYYFIGWEGQEKLEVVTADTTVIAKYAAETDTKSNEQALYDASLQNAENTNYSVVAEAGQKAVSQEKAVEKDPRTAEEIVNDIIEHGKTEVGQDINKEVEK